MAKIAGIYANGFGAPVPGVKLVLTARTTSAGVIMTTNAAQDTGADGSYSFDVLTGVYVVTASGKYLGVITIGADSPDGTLNDYLAGYDPNALTPEIVETIEALVKEARAAAEAAADAAQMAQTAADSVQDAAEAISGLDTENIALVNKKNTFTERQNFNEGIDVKTTGSQSSFDRLNVTGSFWSLGSSEFEGDVVFAHRTGKGSVDLYCPLIVRNNQRIKLYSSGGSSFSGIEFYLSGMTAVQGGIYPNTSKSRLELWHKTLSGLEINLPNAEPDGLKFVGKDKIERALYHSGYLPPAAVVAGELPAEVTQPVFYFDEAANQLYFLNGDKKYNVTLTPA
ncbi:hypothetical protein ICE59_004083 [Salmonella enterica subsp. enterica serovar Agama]|nr:hypothetical protein [Salmonella enterica subsp. enterica serovar Agama]